MSVFVTQRLIARTIKITKPLVTVGVISVLIGGCGGSGSNDSDPLAVDTPVAYVERPVPADDNGMTESEDVMEPDTFNGGATLYIRDRSNQSANETNVTGRAFPAGAIYDVKDVEVSYDGRKLLFAMRAPQLDNVDEEDQPKWNLWEYDMGSNSLEPIIQDAIRAEEGHDISPAYLPDGRIIFTSTRQVRSRAILLDEGKSGYAATVNDEDIFNLHIIDPINDPNGTNITQITFNQGHDLQPTVLSSGRIAFLRSDTGDGRDNLSLYTINSDGSDLRILYGYHSQETGNISGNETTFIDVRERSNGSLVAILQTRDSDQLGGDIVQIDSDGFTDINQPTYDNRADTGVGQSSVTVGGVNLDGDKSGHGYFNSAYPFSDGSLRFLVSWNPCRLVDPNEPQIILACTPDNVNNNALEFADPFYGLWVYDASGGTQVPVASATAGRMFTDAVIMESRALPPVSTADPAIDSDLEGNGLGVLHIRSVYDTDGTDTVSTDTNGAFPAISSLANPSLTSATDRPARFLRLIKAVSIPSNDVLDFDNSAFGVNQGRSMREILGYVPIEPDGSVKVEVPADVAFYFDVVDLNGERISPIHRNWLHVKAGETYECTGCHTATSETPHGRLNAEAPSANPGGVQFGLPFPNTEPGLFIDEIGETMAEVYTRVNDNRSLSTGMVYSDDWTDPNVRAKDPDYSVLYAGMTTPVPASSGCQTTWQANCRTVVNYIDHIQPLWDVSRPDGLGGDNQCISCHTRGTAGALQEPSAQLTLTDLYAPGTGTNDDDYYSSYVELFGQNGLPFLLDPNGVQLPIYTFNFINGVLQFYLDSEGNEILDANGSNIPEIRPAQAGDNNLLVQSFTGNVGDVYEDINGDPILDSGGVEIIRTIAVDASDRPRPAVMATSNAVGSRFFDEIVDGTNAVDHTGFMSTNELRLLREWLDIGGQYYNNPFDAPLN